MLTMLHARGSEDSRTNMPSGSGINKRVEKWPFTSRAYNIVNIARLGICGTSGRARCHSGRGVIRTKLAAR